MTQDLLQEFQTATGRFFQLLVGFDQQAINEKPASGGWTAAQVGEHVFKSDSMLLQWLHRAAAPATRPIDAAVADIRSQFLDFSTRLHAPEQIMPSNGTHDKEALLSALKATREQIRQVITGSDLSAACTDTLFGEATRLEMIHFINVHTLRHVNQLEKIKNATPA
jgi:hypothetical protein